MDLNKTKSVNLALAELNDQLTSYVTYYETTMGKIASDHVKQLARTILQQNPSLDEFVMGMGTSFFTYKDKHKNYIPIVHFSAANDDIIPKYCHELRDFITIWDHKIHITGEPMRFTAYGEIVTSW